MNDHMIFPASTGTAHSLILITPVEALSDPALLERWESLMDLLHPSQRVFASPIIYEHSCRQDSLGHNRVAVIRDSDGGVVGICPIVSWRLEMPFTVRKRVFAKFLVRAATILSCQPLIPDDPALFRLLFKGLLEKLDWCDCVYIDSMPVDSPTSRFLFSKQGPKRPYLIYPSRPVPREWIYLEMDQNLEGFLAQKHKRTRNTLKRRVKKLTEKGGGALECIRVENEGQIDEFYHDAFAIAEKSWQFQNLGRRLDETALYRENLQHLAQIGCLRAYLLKCGGRPAAFVIGYQCGDVLQFEQTAYDPELSMYSPGTVLYYLMMQDLYQHRRPSFVNHGIGVTPHKRLFCNRASLDTQVFLFRPTLRNRFRCSSHGLFYKGLKLAKRIAGKRVTPAASELHEDE
jgi:Acetyltransferase (GNAT) domain